MGVLLIGLALLSLISCVHGGGSGPSSDPSGLGADADGPHESPSTPAPSESSALSDRISQEDLGEPPSSVPPAAPEPLRGIYLTGWAAGTRLDETIDYIQRHGLNALVIDVKDTDGRLSFALPGTLAEDLGANAGKMGSAEAVQRALGRLKDQGIYVIGRVALFQDNFLPHKRPEWAVRKSTGELWRDVAGNYWLDPTHPAVLDYHVEIAVAAAKLGFDEIQFDYIRYPSQRALGYNDAPREDRIAAITDFVAAARARIQEQVNIPVSGALFGIIAVSESDHRLGQELVSLIETMEYVSPMFYPSHYRAGDFGLSRPGDEPYKTVFASMAAALGRTSEAQWKRLRPWIQSFFGYGAQEVEAQIRALNDLGIESFLVWNPSGRYVDGVDYVLADDGTGPLAGSPFRSILYTLMSPAAGVLVPDAALKLPSHLDFLPRVPGGDLRIDAARQAGGYRIEVLRRTGDEALDESEESVLLLTLRQLGNGDAPVPAGGSDVVSPGAKSSSDGAQLRWRDAGYEWTVWAPSMEAALAAKGSLQSLPTELF